MPPWALIGTSAAVILYFVAQKFKVFEDPRIDQVEEALPSANCGGCGFAGCRAFAEACVKADKLDDLNCPVGGNETMGSVASILGLEAVKKEPRVAFIRCNGTCDHRPKTSALTEQLHVPLHHRFTVGSQIVNTVVLVMATVTMHVILMLLTCAKEWVFRLFSMTNVLLVALVLMHVRKI